MPRQPATTPGLNWNDLRFVLAVARSQGLAAASRTLKVDETTVSRRLAHVEIALGSRLFDRLDGKLQPTEAGSIAVSRAERIESEVEQLQSQASNADGMTSGNVRITSIPLVVNRLLIPNLKALHSNYPRLTVEAVAEPRNLSLMRRDADIALRLARPSREQNVVSRRIGDLDYAVYGPRTGKAASLPWITYESGMGALPHVVWIDNAIRRCGAAANLRVNDSEVALHAIKAGIGQSLLPRLIGDATPGLKKLSGAAPVLTRELWLLLHPEIRSLRRVAVVVEWLTDVVAQATHGGMSARQSLA